MTPTQFHILVFLIFNLQLRVGDIQKNRGPYHFINMIVALGFTVIISWATST